MSDWQNQTTAKWELDLFIMSMITDRIGWQQNPFTNKSQPLQFPKKQIHLEQISPVATMSLVKNSSILKIA